MKARERTPVEWGEDNPLFYWPTQEMAFAEIDRLERLWFPDGYER